MKTSLIITLFITSIFAATAHAATGAFAGVASDTPAIASVVLAQGQVTYELRNHFYQYRCEGGACRHIATHVDGIPDIFLTEPPNEAETEAAGYPLKIQAPNYSCQRDDGSYWLCGQVNENHCFPVMGYACQAKPGFKGVQCPGGCSGVASVEINGVSVDIAPDQLFYIPADQANKLGVQ